MTSGRVLTDMSSKLGNDSQGNLADFLHRWQGKKGNFTTERRLAFQKSEAVIKARVCRASY